MPIIQTGIGEIETVEHGDGRQAFVMVHAAGAGPHAFDRLVRLLSNEDRRFMAGARIGYGKTDITAAGDLISRNVAAVRALISDCVADELIVFGHSMGGLVSLLAAASMSAQTARKLKALILYDPILVALLRPEVAAEREALEWDRAVITRFQSEMAAGRAEAGVQAFIEAWNAQPWQNLPDSARAQFIGLAETLAAETSATSYYPLQEEGLRRIDVPTLILVGERSPPLIHLTVARAAELIPKVKVELIADVDHMGPVNKPRAVAPAIEEFLRQL